MTAIRPAADRLLNCPHETTALLVTATVLLGSLTMTATALGDPELVAVLAALGCGLALLGLGLTAMRRRARSPSAPAGV